jgi:hypothetical protein
LHRRDQTLRRGPVIINPVIHRLACPGCGIELAFRDDAQEICSRCGSRVFGERFDPARSPVPREIAALARLREPSHWDRLLSLFLLLVAATWMTAIGSGVVACVTGTSVLHLVMFVGAGLGAAGAWRVHHLERRGVRMALWGFSIVAVSAAALLWKEFRDVWGPAWEEEIPLLIGGALVLVVSLAPIAALAYAMCHPVLRYRFGFIAREDLERMLGPNRYGAMIHRLSIDGGWD